MSLSFSEFQSTESHNKKRQSTLGKPKIVDTRDIQPTEKNKKQVITSFSEDNNLADFAPLVEPLDNPVLIQHTKLDNNVNPEPIKYSPLFDETAEQPRYSNYNQIYEKPMTSIGSRKPYYAEMGISSSSSSEMDKIREELRYIKHLLEEQKNEKTDNIAEEFILYTFVGVFIIYVVDSFSRSAKYIR